MRKLIVPLSLLIHTIGVLIYYLVPSDERSISYSWGVYFHVMWALSFGVCCFLPVILRRFTYIDKQFMAIWGIYNTIMGIAFVLDYYKRINPHGLILASLAIGITTFIIIKSGIKHGFFKN